MTTLPDVDKLHRVTGTGRHTCLGKLRRAKARVSHSADSMQLVKLAKNHLLGLFLFPMNLYFLGPHGWKSKIKGNIYFSNLCVREIVKCRLGVTTKVHVREMV